MATRTVYLFDPVTGLFTGSYEAHESPEEPGVYIAPVHSTAKPLPGLSANEAAVFNPATDVWTKVADFRGQTFYDQVSGAPVVIEALGPVAANLAATRPEALLLAEAKAAKIVEIEAARDAACNANAAALGYTWQADARSQTLLNAAINLAQAGLPLPAAWRSADNTNMPVTALADLLAIAGVIAVQTQAAYAQSWARKAEVEAATTLAEVAAVVW